MNLKTKSEWERESKWVKKTKPKIIKWLFGIWRFQCNLKPIPYPTHKVHSSLSYRFSMSYTFNLILSYRFESRNTFATLWHLTKWKWCNDRGWEKRFKTKDQKIEQIYTNWRWMISANVVSLIKTNTLYVHYFSMSSSTNEMRYIERAKAYCENEWKWS